MLARMQPWWCYKDGGGDGPGGGYGLGTGNPSVGPGTGRNEANPAAGIGFGSASASSGVSQGGGQRSTGSPNQPGSKSAQRSASLGTRSRGSRNPGGISGTPSTRSTGSPTQPGTNPSVPMVAVIDEVGLVPQYTKESVNVVVDPSKVGKVGQQAPVEVEEIEVTAPPNTPQDQRQRTRGRTSTGNPNQPGTRSRNVAVAPGAYDARTTPVSFLAGIMGLDEDSRQVNLNYNPAEPEYGGGGDSILDQEQNEEEETPQEEEATTAEAESESGIEAPSYSDGGGSSSGSGSSSSTGMITATADAPTVASLLDLINNQTAAATTPATGTEATPAYGLEDTRITRRPLTDPNLRTTSLTNLGVRNMGTANPVVDPFTGTVYANPSAARSAGITNWVYKYVYDSKKSGSSLYSAVIS